MTNFKEIQKQAAEASVETGPKKKGSAWAATNSILLTTKPLWTKKYERINPAAGLAI